MTRVLVVHHDRDIADAEVAELRAAGYEADSCAGPSAGGGCPVMNGEPCWQVEWADVLVYDLHASGDGGRELILDIRSLHPDKPIALTSPGPSGDWVEKHVPAGLAGFLGAPVRNDLVAAVKAAMRDAKKAKASSAPVPPHRGW